MAKEDREDMLELDGAHGEGGGQLVRTAVALSAITGTPVRLFHIRAGRQKPGLAAQHLAAVRAVGTLCDAKTSGLELRSKELTFAPGPLRGGAFRFDVGTAGSVTLVLQALLPAMLHGGERCEVTVTGGTDVRMAPPLDYLREVLLPHLGRMGAQVSLCVARRGYFPRGGGEVTVAAVPWVPKAVALDEPGALHGLAGLAHVAGLPVTIAERMRAAALGKLQAVPGPRPALAVAVEEAPSPGGAVVAWARLERSGLGAGLVAERGVRAEALGEAVGAELAQDLAAGAGVDVHAADQLLIYLALAKGGAFTTRALSRHAETAMWLIEQFLPVRFEATTKGELVRVEVRPR